MVPQKDSVICLSAGALLHAQLMLCYQAERLRRLFPCCIRCDKCTCACQLLAVSVEIQANSVGTHLAVGYHSGNVAVVDLEDWAQMLSGVFAMPAWKLDLFGQCLLPCSAEPRLPLLSPARLCVAALVCVCVCARRRVCSTKTRQSLSWIPGENGLVSALDLALPNALKFHVLREALAIARILRLVRINLCSCGGWHASGLTASSGRVKFFGEASL